MKGIYLSEEGKQEIEDKIVELENVENIQGGNLNQYIATGKKRAYEEILSSATIIPVEESWKIVAVQTMMSPVTESYPQGVIIQPKR